MTITTQQARQRFTIIPSPLQDAMFSVQTGEIMDGITQQYHLDDSKSAAIGKIVGWVLLGFIHPEDVSREIQQQLNLLPQLAGEISKSLDVKIFASLKDDLNAAYAPAPIAVGEGAAPSSPAAPAPKILSESFSATPNVKMVARPGVPVPTASATAPQQTPSIAAAPVRPGVSNTAGWSRQTPQDPVVKLGVITPNMPKPVAPMPAGSMPGSFSAPVKPTAGSTGMAVTPQQPKPAAAPKTMSEFERLDAMKKGLAPAATPRPMPAPVRPAAPTIPVPTPATPPSPPPVMLHEVGTPGQPQQTPNFQINQGMQNQMRSQPTSGQASNQTRPVVIEFGSAPKPVQPPRPLTPPPAPRPQAQPQQPSQPGQPGKVIVRDFLDPQK